MGLPTPEHVIFIPGVLLIGLVLGYIIGVRTARAQSARLRERAKK